MLDMEHCLKRKKVLVVDDDPVVRILVSEYLKTNGHNVSVSGDGQNCLLKLKEDLPDLVLLDLQMPDMDGIEVLRRIRTNPETASLRVLMLSANADAVLMAEQNKLKLDGHILKPFQMDTLLNVLDEVE